MGVSNYKKYHIIIFKRGGNRNFGALQLFQGNTKYSVAYPFTKLAKEGYAVFGCNYRGSGKSGTNNAMFELKADCEYNAKGPEIDWKNGM